MNSRRLMPNIGLAPPSVGATELVRRDELARRAQQETCQTRFMVNQYLFGSRRAVLGVAVIQAFFVGDMLCQHFVY